MGDINNNVRVHINSTQPEVGLYPKLWVVHNDFPISAKTQQYSLKITSVKKERFE